MRALIAALVTSSAVLAGCGGSDGGDPEPGPQLGRDDRSPSASRSSPQSSSSSPTSPSPSVTAGAEPRVVGTIARRFEVPWGIAFLPDGTALVTERDSREVFHVSRSDVRRVGTVEQAEPTGEAGLLGVAVSPSYDEDATVFLYATTSEDNRVLRTTFRDGRIGRLRPVLTGIPRNVNHDGGRMAFGPDGMLYVATGEAGQPDLAQDRENLGGKILRITPDGDPAPGNPDPGSPVWTWGHRNVQGLAFDDDGNLWASEFGQDTWDELNLIRGGRNYGWPRVEGKGGGPRYEDPQVQWPTSEASPSGLAFLGGKLWLAALRGERLWRIDVEGRRASNPTPFFVGGYGRLRTVEATPAGRLWLTTSNRDGRGDPADADDRILLVRP